MDASLSLMSNAVSSYSFWQQHYLMMDLAYWCAAMCIAFKMVWIIRQVSTMHFWNRWPITLTASLVTLAVLIKALSRFHGGDAATIYDIARELSLCGFLVSTIFMLQRQTKRF